MAYTSVTNTFVNGVGNIIDATAVNANFTDIVNGLSNGTKDFNMSAGTLASNLTVNGNVTEAGNVTMSGASKALTLNGDATIAGNVVLSGTSKAITVAGDLTVSQDTTTNKLEVVSTSKLGGAVGIGKNPSSTRTVDMTTVNDKPFGIITSSTDNYPAFTMGQGYSTLAMHVGSTKSYLSNQSASNPLLIESTLSDTTISSYDMLSVASGRMNVALTNGLNITGTDATTYVTTGITLQADTDIVLAPSNDLYINGLTGDTTDVVISGVTLHFNKGILTSVS